MFAKRKAAGLVGGEAAKQNPNRPYRIAQTPSRQGVEGLLSKLERVKRTGTGTWQARCPAHADKSPSLRIRETGDGTVLVHCFAGCAVHDVVAAVGLELSDLFPHRPADPAHAGRPERRPFPAADILRAIAFEASIIVLAEIDLRNGKPLGDKDHERLLIAFARINAALDAGGLHHG